MGDRVSEMQEEAKRIQRIKQLKISTVRQVTLDIILINLKSFISTGIMCIAALYVFEHYKLDMDFLLPTGFLIGISKFLFYTLPEQKAAKTLRALELLYKLDQEKLLDKKVDQCTIK